MSDYTARNIRILDWEERQRFTWHRAEDLAAQYPGVSSVFIARLLEACGLAGCPERLAIARYLDRDRSVEVLPELIECHKSLVDQQNRF